MSSLLWPVIAMASALRRQQAEVAAGGQWPWPAELSPRWRSRSAVALAPAHSSVIVSPPCGTCRPGAMFAGIARRSCLPASSSARCDLAARAEPAMVSHVLAARSARVAGAGTPAWAGVDSRAARGVSRAA
jgi:hypothetical protein